MDQIAICLGITNRIQPREPLVSKLIILREATKRIILQQPQGLQEKGTV